VQSSAHPRAFAIDTGLASRRRRASALGARPHRAADGTDRAV